MMTDLMATQRNRKGLVALGALMLALALAACAGSENPPANSVPQPTKAAPQSAGATAIDSDVRTRQIGISTNVDLGKILTDADGMTLYMFDRDTENVSNCSGACLNAWPPMIVDETPDAGNGTIAVIGTITREDDSTQVTINGMPVYYWANDTSAGDVGGQSVGGVWWVMDAAGDAMRGAAESSVTPAADNGGYGSNAPY